MDYKEHLSLRLKILRTQKGIAQEKISRILDISTSSWRAYEYGRMCPSLETIIKTADYFDVSIDWLLGRDDRFVGIGVKLDSYLNYKDNKDFNS